MGLSSEEIIEQLGLARHSTCGYVCETFRSAVIIPKSALPAGYDGDRPLGNVLHFLVTPDAPVKLHANRSDQMYHHYLGDPLEVLLLYSNGQSEVKHIGSDIAAGMSPQLFLPGGTYHTARVRDKDRFALLGTSVWLRAEPFDIAMGDPAQLQKSYPAAAAEIASFTSRGRPE